jgi:methylated-DNA-[protein]-cysteine S-methyltransferase
MEKKSGLYIGETSETPLGKLWLAVSDLGLVAIECGVTQSEFEAYLVKRFKRPVEVAPEQVRTAAGQLIKYLSGQQQAFSLVIDWTVLRPFQQAVLRATSEIPYGETRTYKEIADRQATCRACRGPRRSHQSDAACAALSSCNRCGWEIARIWSGRRD